MKTSITGAFALAAVLSMGACRNEAVPRRAGHRAARQEEPAERSNDRVRTASVVMQNGERFNLADPSIRFNNHAGEPIGDAQAIFQRIANDVKAGTKAIGDIASFPAIHFDWHGTCVQKTVPADQIASLKIASAGTNLDSHCVQYEGIKWAFVTLTDKNGMQYGGWSDIGPLTLKGIPEVADSFEIELSDVATITFR